MSDDDLAEMPQDPMLEKVRRKMVRLLVVSIAVLFIGLIAVLSAIVYRTKGGDASRTAAPPVLAAGVQPTIELPAGARLAETSLDGDTVLLRAVLPNGTEELLVLDLAAGSVVARYPIGNGVQSSAPTQ